MSARKAFACILSLLLWTVLMTACQSQAGKIQPPKINYGQDICDRCGMIISEVRYASAIQLSNGDYLKFDDIGEMFAYHADNPGLEIVAWWVHDFSSEEWISGETAFYVKREALGSPMGTGITCFANEADATQYAAEHGGNVYPFEKIQKILNSHSMGG